MSEKAKTAFRFNRHKTLRRVYQKINYLIIRRHIYGLTAPLRVLPDFIVIGVVRGGTTSLYHYLSQHPCIARAAYDELGFFDTNYELGINWYRSLFPTKLYARYVRWRRKHFMTFDVTPFYIYNPDAAERIRDTLPHVKIIVVLRNPVDRAYSNYNLGVRNKDEKRSFEEAIKFEVNKIHEYGDLPKDKKYFEQIVAYSYIARGFYAEQIAIWFKLFSKDQIFIISSEDLEEKENDTLTTIFDFLELPKCKINDLAKMNKADYPPMDPQTRSKLIDYFRPHNEKLYALLGRRFEWDR